MVYQSHLFGPASKRTTDTISLKNDYVFNAGSG